jgi:hypothetical protein
MLPWLQMTEVHHPAAALAAARRAGIGVALGAWTVAATLACTPPARMCSSSGDCSGPSSSCVAGRCIAGGAVPAISTARRVVYEPVDVGYVSRGERAAPGVVATLGRTAGARAFLRFAVALRPEESVVEAFLAIERAPDVESDPAPIVVHVARVLDPWDGRSLSWATQPRVQDVGLPETRVSPASGARVRLDVRELVQRWRLRETTPLAVAVLADAASPTGVAFALAPGRTRGPELELYVK